MLCARSSRAAGQSSHYSQPKGRSQRDVYSPPTARALPQSDRSAVAVTARGTVLIDALVSIIDRLIQLKTYRDTRLQEVYQSLLEPLFDDLLLIHRDYIQLFETTRRMLPSLDVVVNTWQEVEGGVDGQFADESAAITYASEKAVRRYRLTSKVSHAVIIALPPDGPSITIGFRDLTDARRFAAARGIDPATIHAVPPVRTPDADLEKLRRARDFVREARLVFEPVRTKLKKLTEQAASAELGDEARAFVVAVAKYFPDGKFQSERTGSGASSILQAFERRWEDLADAHDANQCVFDVEFLLDTLRDDARQRWAEVCETYASLKIAIVGRG